MNATVVELGGFDIQQFWQRLTLELALSVKLRSGICAAMDDWLGDHHGGWNRIIARLEQTVILAWRVLSLPRLQSHGNVQITEACDDPHPPLFVRRVSEKDNSCPLPGGAERRGGWRWLCGCGCHRPDGSSQRSERAYGPCLSSLGWKSAGAHGIGSRG
jgi:hypothetical protein